MLAADEEMLTALDGMLRSNEKITARSVVRNVVSLGAASSITRDSVRSGYLEEYQVRQAAIQKHQRGLEKEVRGKAAELLARKDAEIAQLKHQISLLTASHVALVRAAGEVGGTKAWKRLFDGYSKSIDELKELGALPAAEIHLLPSPKGGKK
ncbi:MAG TPA: hypothetical protein VM659_20130 [Dongiaceae bacterium]|nr:hypothetical protein [Dongiaceae bacterium]